MPQGVEDWAGQSQGWRYLAQRIDGSGQPGVFLDNELPLHDVSITDVLSGPPQITATISPVIRRLLAADGLPLLGEWATAVYAEEEGVIRAGGLVVASTFAGPADDLEVSGFSGYAKDMGYEPATAAGTAFVETDPLDIVRHIWSHIQAGQSSNLGLVVDATTRTPRRVGKQPAPTNADGSTTAQPDTSGGTASTNDKPYVLDWQTDDLGGEIDTFAKDTPFDYHERHQWNADKTAVEHYLDFGYPTIGTRRNARFVVGENVQIIPKVVRDGAGYANHVRVLGAGEGSAMIRGEARVRDGRLRRMRTIDDKSITDESRARTAARNELARRLAIGGITEFAVLNSPQAPLGTWGVGDEVRVQAELDWLSFDWWVRVLSITIRPEDPQVATMSVIRSDKLAV